MRRVYLGFLIVLIAFLNVMPVFAQETPAKEPTVEDPFSDYSHLWEESKKKKKKKKSKKSKEQVSLPQTMPVDSLPKFDSLNQQEDPKPEEEAKEQKPETQNVSTPASTPSNPPQTETNTPTETNPSATDIGKDLLESQLTNELPLDDFRKGLPFGGGKNSFEGGITYANIGGESYVGMSLSPEFKIGKVGIGLNVPILYGLDSKSFRTEIFKDGVGAARLVRYIRYGTQKQDPVYVKVGELNNLMIGYGSLINNYTNSTSYEKRKVGLHYDINFKGIAGIEGMYSDFDPSGLNLFVLRPYVRPFSKMPIPIVKTFEIGATFIKDKDQTKRPTSDSTFITNTFTKPGIGAFGIDAGVTLLRVPFVQIDAFMSYAKLKTSSKVLTDSLTVIYNSTTNEPALLSDGFEDASGFSYGVNFKLHFIADIFSTDIRIERLTYGEHYLPQFFDATYELGKDSKILSLANASKTAGIYGSLSGNILQKVIIGGSLMIPDDVSETSPATVRIHADMDRLADKFSLHGSYIKGGLADLGDAFSFDERSLAKLRVVYHLNKYLATGLDYYWAFTQVSDGSYKATKYVSPYFGLSVQF
jgi:hypothetical protein